MAKSKVAWKFQFVGTSPVQGLFDVIRKGKPTDAEGVVLPNDIVVVGTVDEANWLRSLTDFKEVASPTTDKPSHKKRKAPAKKAPANAG